MKNPSSDDTIPSFQRTQILREESSVSQLLSYFMTQKKTILDQVQSSLRNFTQLFNKNRGQPTITYFVIFLL